MVELNTIKTVDESPFKYFVMTIGEMPTSYVDSMTYYEMLAWLCKFLQDEVVPVVNNNSAVTKELQEYVEHYFDNLDVQKEINNKLDEMAESGELEAIINEYLQSNVAWCFDTVADMKNATNLIAGGYARTLGFNSINDGGDATYYITDSGTANEMDIIAIGDSLYANLVKPAVLAPEQVGCAGDGTTNDTTAFARACAISKYVQGKGNYLVNTISLSNVDIKANIYARETTGVTFTDNVTFEGTLNHTVGGNVDDGAVGIYITGDNCTIKNSTFTGVYTGIAIGVYSSATNVIINGCRFKPDFKIDIWCSGENVTINECTFDEHTASTTATLSVYGNGIKVSQYRDFTEANKSNIKITNNTILAHGDNPIDCYTGATSVIIDGNVITSTNTQNLEIKADGENEGENNREYVITNNIMTGARNIRITNNNNANLTDFIIEGNQFYTNAGSCLILENIFDIVIANCQFRGANQTAVTAINHSNSSTEVIKKMVLTNCTFDNFYRVISDGTGFNYADVYLNNVIAKNIPLFTRVRSNTTLHLENCDIESSGVAFSNVEKNIYIVNSKIAGTTLFNVASGNAMISLLNCILNASSAVFARGSTSYKFKYVLVGCDYSGSESIGNANMGIEDSVAFSTVD